ncbi:hypothetical protein H920_10001 [Fukomys damarensis]|uniref:Uncharacterized protein n=1 Tax=Fukomys damarensis TaxID=885580 RepID=A0A091DC01_FUKDA|nr:hypothetical protein H920_10001 [Fukomys damarensis]
MRFVKALPLRHGALYDKKNKDELRIWRASQPKYADQIVIVALAALASIKDQMNMEATTSNKHVNVSDIKPSMA